MTIRHPLKRLVGHMAAAATLTVLVGFSGQAQAQAYPNKPLKFIVPFSADSATDAVGRIIAQAMGEALGQSSTVENKAGANGILGAEAVKGSLGDDRAAGPNGGGLGVLSVPYKSIPSALTDLLGGNLQFAFGDVGNAVSQMNSGRLRGLGVTTAKRAGKAPRCPRLATLSRITPWASGLDWWHPPTCLLTSRRK